MIKNIFKDDQKIGRWAVLLVAFMVFAGLSRFAKPSIGAESDEAAPGFLTSEGCKQCHPEVFRQWKMTSHARMLRNAEKDSTAIHAHGFTDEIPFAKEDIEYALGSHWIQKYLVRIEGDLYILPKFWNIVEDKWEPYSIWNWRSKPYSDHCNWCHSVGYDTEEKKYAEESIGCESCHGPGAKHGESEDPEDIINPANLTKERADMICEACHTDGKDSATKTYPFPNGFLAGEDVTDYYTDFFMPKPGSKGWYKGEATYLERHRMFLFWQSKFYSTARACEVCEFDRGISKKVEKRMMSRDEYCGTCHGEIFRDFEGHSKHSPKDVQCVQCHVPLLDSTGERYSIHDHKFDFSGPELLCAECHGDETLKGGDEHSHKFKFNQVQIKENLTLEQACERCHPEPDHG